MNRESKTKCPTCKAADIAGFTILASLALFIIVAVTMGITHMVENSPIFGDPYGGSWTTQIHPIVVNDHSYIIYEAGGIIHAQNCGCLVKEGL